MKFVALLKGLLVSILIGLVGLIVGYGIWFLADVFRTVVLGNMR